MIQTSLFEQEDLFGDPQQQLRNLAVNESQGKEKTRAKQPRSTRHPPPVPYEGVRLPGDRGKAAQVRSEAEDPSSPLPRHQGRTRRDGRGGAG